ncbi:ROK family protein [Clavibacter zhangzhiyongii]|uniref:ROK family protein n=1 Tax=Clavibacter zhangzhiyongii TaxID=2768071 RepID=A0A7L7Z051_9MICO|nr:ROK family protein [Clavibacter zhangzhiyongii]QOD43094.1 ROK family protein [Clavibacter zhangzhiyongii]
MRIGLDIGGTKIEAVAVDGDDLVVSALRRPAGHGGVEVLDNAVRAVEELVARLGEPVVASVGVGIPGMVDPATGTVQHAVNLGIDGFPFGPGLETRLGVPVALENDVNAAAVGVSQLLGLRGSLAYLNVGTGLAAGLVTDGVLLRGARGGAGEIGHVPVDPAGLPCPCGQRGCLETTASGAGVARQWSGTGAHAAVEVFRAAERGDPLARDIRLRLAEGIAAAVRILVLTNDVDAVVVGGGVSRLGAPLLDDVLGVLARQAATSPFLASLGIPDRVRLLPPELPAASVGAALLRPAHELDRPLPR